MTRFSCQIAWVVVQNWYFTRAHFGTTTTLKGWWGGSVVSQKAGHGQEWNFLHPTLHTPHTSHAYTTRTTHIGDKTWPGMKFSYTAPLHTPHTSHTCTTHHIHHKKAFNSTCSGIEFTFSPHTYTQMRGDSSMRYHTRNKMTKGNHLKNSKAAIVCNVCLFSFNDVCS